MQPFETGTTSTGNSCSQLQRCLSYFWVERLVSLTQSFRFQIFTWLMNLQAEAQNRSW